VASGGAFNHETIILDGETFEDCEFRNCRLVYAGGEPPELTGCRFEDCEWKFEEAAARTLEQLRRLWSIGEKASVQALIKTITGAAR
jgi:hypothetical protein